MGKKAIPTKILHTFETALDKSRDHNTVFLATIAQEMEVSKVNLSNWLNEYDELVDIMDMINTNLEANILRLVQMKMVDTKFAQFALEAVHGWKADGDDGKQAKILVEGIGTSELVELLTGEEENEDN